MFCSRGPRLQFNQIRSKVFGMNTAEGLWDGAAPHLRFADAARAIFAE
jgi:hypothetical protein